MTNDVRGESRVEVFDPLDGGPLASVPIPGVGGPSVRVEMVNLPVMVIEANPDLSRAELARQYAHLMVDHFLRNGGLRR